MKSVLFSVLYNACHIPILPHPHFFDHPDVTSLETLTFITQFYPPSHYFHLGHPISALKSKHFSHNILKPTVGLLLFTELTQIIPCKRINRFVYVRDMQYVFREVENKLLNKF